MSSPRSPSSPPPPPPNYPSFGRPPCPPRPQSFTKPPTSGRSTGSQADRTNKKVERKAKRLEKEATAQAKRQERIRKAFVSHQSSATACRDAVEIVVSNTLYNDQSKHDVLKSIRVAFPDQTVPIARSIQNLITWRRIQPTNAQDASQTASEQDVQTEDVPMCVFVFRAEHYLTHIDRNTLNECATSVKDSCLPSHRIVFAICGMDREIRLRARRDVRNAVDTFIVDKKAVQDSYVHLYMDYEIRTHDVHDLDELAHYLRDVTNAIAAAPYRKEDDLISASLSLRRKRAKAAFRTAVVSAPSEATEKDGTGSEEQDIFSFDGNQKSNAVRIEGLNDLGNLYLTMLCLIPGVTIKKAQCIREKFPTLRVLLDAYDECSSDKQRDLLISELRYSENGRRLGPALSKSVASVLTSVQGDVPV